MNPNDSGMLHHPNPEEKRPFEGEIRELREEDVKQLKPIIAHWHLNNVRKRMDPEQYLESVYQKLIESTQRKTGRRYFVATNKDDQVIGVMGMTRPDDEIIDPFVTSENCVEVINAFVSPNSGLRGVGQALFDKIQQEAKLVGADELIVSSGQIFKERGWPFWTKNFGEPVHVYKDYWNQPNTDVVVWRKSI